MPEYTLPLPTDGIDTLSEDTALPEGAVREALNVDIAREGVTRSRQGARLALAEPGLHSLWAGADGVFAVKDAVLYRINTGPSVSKQALATLPNDAALSYAQTPRGVVFVSYATSGMIADGSVRPIAPQDGQPPTLTATTSGGLAAGTYGVATTFLIGDEESALSRAAYVSVLEGGGVALSAIPSADADTVRIYRTTANGGEYYRAADLAVGMTQFVLSDGGLGRPCDTRYLERIERGQIVRFWNGRLLVANGNDLLISEPLRYGLYSPRFGFVQRPSRITMIAPTDGAVFVATERDTVAITGRNPGEWIVNRVDAGRAVAGSDVQVSLDSFAAEWSSSSALGSAWLSNQGYIVGFPDGTVVSPQTQRLRLTGLRHGRTSYFNRRLLTAAS